MFVWYLEKWLFVSIQRKLVGFIVVLDPNDFNCMGKNSSSEYPLLCSTEERNFYRFGTMRVNYVSFMVKLAVVTFEAFRNYTEVSCCWYLLVCDNFHLPINQCNRATNNVKRVMKQHSKTEKSNLWPVKIKSLNPDISQCFSVGYWACQIRKLLCWHLFRFLSN